jgi:hypothetical protein
MDHNFTPQPAPKASAKEGWEYLLLEFFVNISFVKARKASGLRQVWRA